MWKVIGAVQFCLSLVHVMITSEPRCVVRYDSVEYRLYKKLKDLLGLGMSFATMFA